MLLFLNCMLLGAVFSHPVVREPCKVQCDLNFSRNFIEELPILIPFCHRGCDLFKVALISTKSYDSIPIKPPSKEKHPIVRVTLERADYTPESNDISRFKQIPEPKEISKTTSQPIIQPVQDHPVDTGKHSSTTKVPSNTNLSFNDGKYGDHSQKSVEDDSSYKNNKNVHKNKNLFEEAKHSCRHACVKAYGGAAEQEACVVGCHLQSTTHEEPDFSKDINDSSLKSIQRSMFNFAGHIGRLVRFSWSWTAPKQEETGRLQVYGTQDASKHSAFPFFINIKSSSSVFEPSNVLQKKVAVVKPDIAILRDIMDKEFSMKPLSLDLNNRDDIDVFRVFDHKMKERKESHQRNGARITEIKTGIQTTEIKSSLPIDLLACISRKTGLPRWFVATIFFSSIPFAIWLVISLASGSDDSKNSKSKVFDLDCGCKGETKGCDKHIMNYDQDEKYSSLDEGNMKNEKYQMNVDYYIKSEENEVKMNLLNTQLI